MFCNSVRYINDDAWGCFSQCQKSFPAGDRVSLSLLLRTVVSRQVIMITCRTVLWTLYYQVLRYGTYCTVTVLEKFSQSSQSPPVTISDHQWSSAAISDCRGYPVLLELPVTIGLLRCFTLVQQVFGRPVQYYCSTEPPTVSLSSVLDCWAFATFLNHER